MEKWMGAKRDVYNASVEWVKNRDRKILEEQMIKNERKQIRPHFKPQLNNHYNRMLELDAFDERLEFAETQKAKNKKKVESEMQAKFKPKLNQKSLRMAKNRKPLWAASTTSK